MPEEKKSGIEVWARIRPLMPFEMGESECIDAEGNDVLLNLATGQLRYPFTGISGQKDNNDACFEKVCRKLIAAVKSGANALLIAYGQTGCGKTYTMLGKPRHNPPVLGLLPRTIEVLLSETPKPDLFLSYLVSYGTKAAEVKIYDLLDKDNANEVCSAKHGNFKYPEDMTKKKGAFYGELWKYKNGKTNFNPLDAKRHKIKDYVDGYDMVNTLQQRSHYAPTGKNPDSSRGHTTILVRVDQTSDPNATEIIDPSTFLFVDLAGSEGDTAITPKFVAETEDKIVLERKLEAGVINKGLGQLKRIFADLRTLEKISPSDRNGLKRILYPYINKRSALSVMFMMSPAKGNAQSTNATLKFAQDAAAIKVQIVKNKARVNWKAVYHQLLKQFEEIKESGVSSGGGVLGTVKAPKKPVYLYAGIDANSVKLMDESDFKKMKDEASAKASAKSFSVADIQSGKVKLGENLQNDDPWDGEDRDDELIMTMTPELLNHSELCTRVLTLLAEKERAQFLVGEERNQKESQLEYYGEKARELNESIRKFAGKSKPKARKAKLAFGKN